MRIKNWNVDSDELTRERPVKVKRFRQTTVRKPQTRADLVRAAAATQVNYTDRSTPEAVAYDSWRNDR